MVMMANTSGSPERGSLAATLAGPGDYYNQVVNDPARIASVAQSKAELAASGFDPYGEEHGPVRYRPSRDPTTGNITQGAYAGGYQTGPTGQPYTFAGGGGALGGGTMSGNYTGGGTGGGVGSYELPDSAAASAAMRALQMQSLGGLQGLANQDTAAQRKAIQDALYETSSRGINTAADRARAAMLEGTFGRGVGSSSILTELAGRQQQEQSDALAQAARDAFTQAGSEQRADLASQLGLFQGGFNAGTAGLQGEANVALTNLARQQQESQFGRNLAFQGGENAANRAQSASQFAGNLGLQQAQLAQQASQFGQNMGFVGSQNQLNRDAAAAAQQAQFEQQMAMLMQGQQFTGGQNEAQRALTMALQQGAQTFQGGQNEAQRAAAAALQQGAQGWQGGQNDAQRAFQQLLQQQQNTFSSGQNQLNRDQAMQQFLLSLANSQDIASGNAMSSGLTAGIGGVGNLLGPLIRQWAS